MNVPGFRLFSDEVLTRLWSIYTFPCSVFERKNAPFVCFFSVVEMCLFWRATVPIRILSSKWKGVWVLHLTKSNAIIVKKRTFREKKPPQTQMFTCSSELVRILMTYTIIRKDHIWLASCCSTLTSKIRILSHTRIHSDKDWRRTAVTTAPSGFYHIWCITGL